MKFVRISERDALPVIDKAPPLEPEYEIFTKWSSSNDAVPVEIDIRLL